MKFLVSGVGGPAGESLTKQLESRGHTVIGCDLVPPPGALAAPRADSPALVPFIQHVSAEHGVDVYVPTVQDELLAIAIARDLLDTRVLITAPGPIGITMDKWLTADYLRRHNVAIPRTYRCGEAPESYPVVAKPRVSRGGRGVEVVETAERLAELDDPALIVQEFAPGEEYCPQLFVSPSTGRVECVTLRKTALKEGRVGNAASAERASNPEVEKLAGHVAQALELQGPIDMDIRYTEAGQPVLLEVNARFGANSALAPEILDAFLAEVE